jgi:type II secretory pathway component PulJ
MHTWANLNAAVISDSERQLDGPHSQNHNTPVFHPRGETQKARQAELEQRMQQMRRMQAQINNLKSDTNTPFASRREYMELKQQIEILKVQIQQIQAQQWSRGRAETPPPEYPAQ